MKVSVASWSSRGLRCPDVDISLLNTDGEPARVALIQMPNGTGKTTTLELIRATLTGEASKWAPDRVKEFRRPLSSVEEGTFIITLRMNDRPLTLEMGLDFIDGTVSYKTSTPGSGGVKSRYDPPSQILKFLTPAFLNLFIFDGEFADELLASKAGRADEAIDALCRLDLLTQVEEIADTQWRKAVSKGGPKSAESLNRLRTTEADLIAERDRRHKARASAHDIIADRAKRSEDLKRRIAERLSSVETTRARHAEATLALQTAASSVTLSSATVMNQVRNPLALHPRFAGDLVALKENLDHLKLPETSSAQFFNDLVREPECICGREMTPAARAEIQNRARGFLDSDESGAINILKSQIELFVDSPDGRSSHDRLSDALGELGKAMRARREAQQTLSALAKRLADAGDDELREWQTAIDALQKEMAECNSLLSILEATDEDPATDKPQSLKLLDTRIKETGRKIAELSQTVDLKQKTELLSQILSTTATLARDQIREELVTASNERLEVVLSNDPLRIDRIDSSLHLANQTGASVGQKLSVGYTFLMSALSRGDNDFPLVVDSPANPIDEGVRRSIGKLIPELCTQFVGFTINTERAGFVPALEKASDDCLFLTLFRKTPGTQRLHKNLPTHGVTETDNAVLVRDRDYFMSFDITEEEA